MLVCGIWTHPVISSSVKIFIPLCKDQQKEILKKLKKFGKQNIEIII